MLYAKNSWKNYMIDAGLGLNPKPKYGCPIANTYTKEDVVELLDGYEVLSIEQNHIFPYQIDEYKRGEYVRQPWFAEMPPEMFRTLEKELGLALTDYRETKMKIGVIGAGRLGICFALLLEQAGYDVVVSDVRDDYVIGLNNRVIKTNEPASRRPFR
jgi:hypothetical protein